MSPGRSDFSVDLVVEQKRLQEMDTAFNLRDIDVLPKAARTPFEYCRRECGEAVARRDEIRVCAPGAGWGPIGPAGDAVQPGEGRALAAIAAVRTFGPSLTAQAAAHHDQVWATLAQVVPAKAELCHRAGRKALHHDVRPIDHLVRELAAFFRAEVARQAELG